MTVSMRGVAAVLLLLPAVALADAGRVTVASGETTLARQRVVQKLERGTVITAGDQLQTGADGNAQLWMQDDTLIAMGTNSSVKLDQYASDRAQYSLSDGGVRMVSGSIRPELHTPMAELSVVGTDFTSIICDKQCGSAEKGLYIMVDKGRVRAKNGAGSVEASSGQIIFVAGPGSAPRLITKKPVGLELAMLGFEFNLELVGFDSDTLIQPLPILPGDDDPSPSAP